MQPGEGADGDRDLRHLDVIEQARRQNAEMLLFPEMSLTGHSAGALTLSVAITREDRRVVELSRASGAMLTSFGLIEEGPAAQFYNSCFTVGAAGLRHIHRKINLATYGQLDDGKYFAAGRYIETFVPPGSPDWRCATLICNDYWNPALIYLAALHGATLLLSPVSSGLDAVGGDFDNPASWSTALSFYSMVYGLPIVFANRVGQENGLRFWGGSRIVDARGKILAQAEDGEALVVADLDFEAVRRARYHLPSVRDSNLALVSREIRRLEHILGVPDLVREPNT